MSKSKFNRFRIDDEVATDGDVKVAGVVVALRDVSETRQSLTVRTHEGTLVPVTVDLSNGGTAIVLPPATLNEALGLAQHIAAGHDPRMPISAQLGILANAVISLSAGVIPQTVEAHHGG